MTSSSSVSAFEISNWIDAQPRLTRCKEILLQACIEDGLELQELLDCDREDLEEFCDEHQFRKKHTMMLVKAVEEYKHRRMFNNNEAETYGAANSFPRYAASNNNHNINSNSNTNRNRKSKRNNNGLKMDAGDSERVLQIKQQINQQLNHNMRKQEKQNKRLLESTLHLFERCANLHVKVNEEVFSFLDNNIPIVTIMGPSRQGKSTLINDMMGVDNLCRVSNSANKAETNGAWICLYVHPRTRKPLFYLIDAEGLSHDVTKFTQRLFYVCYAISNVIVWNDKAVGDKLFNECMDKIYSRMTSISRSNQKPAFIYLQRDANGFFDYGKHEKLDNYIQKSETFSYLRNMKIFSSLNGYELRQRPSRTQPFSTRDMSLLTDFISKVCSNSTRFMTNLADSKPQIQEINYSLRLSLDVKLICEHPILQSFYYGFDDGSDEYKANKLMKMKAFAVSQGWKEDQILLAFDAAFYELCYKDNALDDEMEALLRANQRELYQRVKNRKAIAKKELSTLQKVGLGAGFRFLMVMSLGLANTNLESILETLLSNYELGPTDEQKAKARARAIHRARVKAKAKAKSESLGTILLRFLGWK